MFEFSVDVDSARCENTLDELHHSNMQVKVLKSHNKRHYKRSHRIANHCLIRAQHLDDSQSDPFKSFKF